jgi:hypothetical protein
MEQVAHVPRDPKLMTSDKPMLSWPVTPPIVYSVNLIKENTVPQDCICGFEAHNFVVQSGDKDALIPHLFYFEPLKTV